MNATFGAMQRGVEVDRVRDRAAVHERDVDPVALADVDHGAGRAAVERPALVADAGRDVERLVLEPDRVVVHGARADWRQGRIERLAVDHSGSRLRRRGLGGGRCCCALHSGHVAHVAHAGHGLRRCRARARSTGCRRRGNCPDQEPCEHRETWEQDRQGDRDRAPDGWLCLVALRHRAAPLLRTGVSVSDGRSRPGAVHRWSAACLVRETTRRRPRSTSEQRGEGRVAEDRVELRGWRRGLRGCACGGARRRSAYIASATPKGEPHACTLRDRRGIDRSRSCGPAVAPAASGGGASKVALREWAVMPVPTTASAGKITFTVRNSGKTKHEFVVIRTNLAPAKLPVKNGRASEKGAKGEIGDPPAWIHQTPDSHTAKGSVRVDLQPRRSLPGRSARRLHRALRRQVTETTAEREDAGDEHAVATQERAGHQPPAAVRAHQLAIAREPVEHERAAARAGSR